MFPQNQNSSNVLSKIPEALSKGSSGVIILPQNPTQDAIAAACSLYLGLSKIGKNVTVACSAPIQSDLIGADKIQSNLSTGGDNLVISFPFKEESLDKVDYGFQGDFFNVIVTPRPGQPKLEPDNVKFSYTGGNLDFVITVDVPNLNSIGQLYAENQNEFAGKNIINIDRHLVNDNYGTVNFVVKTASSTSELVYKVLEAMQVQLDREIATNLYTGLTAATNNFTSYSVNADTFQAASTFLKAGAMKRPSMRPGAQMPGMQMPRPMPRSPMPMDDFEDEMPMMPTPVPQMRQPMPQQPQQPRRNPQMNNGQQQRPQQQQQRPQGPRPQQQQQPMRQQPRPQPQHVNPINDQPVPFEETMTPIEEVEMQPGTPEAPQAPQDWLKPKIFKGGGLV